MSRLFLRFYLGVIAILIVAWLIQGYVFRQRSVVQNIRVVEQALSGGARLAMQRIANSNSSQREATLDSIRQEFDYPVNLVDANALSGSPRILQRLADGDVVLVNNRIAIAVAGQEQILAFGPLPTFVGPSQMEITLGFGAVFLLSAIAIAILLRPVVSQLRAVERTATAIAQGNLSARIDEAESGRALLPLAVAFNSMAERNQSVLRSQRELLQAVSHELRTPLARIRFATDLIESSESETERNKRLQAVDKATQELDDLVGELLTYVRMEGHEMAARCEVVDVLEFCAELIEIHSPLFPRITFAIEPTSAPVQVTADRASLGRAIGNLLRNAGRFAKHRVVVRALDSADDLVIEVDDDGPGIPVEDRERVFEPFVRLDNSVGHGAGLGLALVQRIAIRHGGSVSASENPQGGARMRFTIPHLASPSRE